MRPSLRIAIVCALAAAAATAWACTVYREPKAFEVPKPAPSDSVEVGTPVRAHLLSGETVFYPTGVIARRDTLIPASTAAHRYSLVLKDLGPVGDIPLDSVLGLESVRDDVNQGASLALTTLTLGVVAVPVVALIACLNNPKCFGSCPTVYSDSAGTPVLEAEGFSYSIAPIFEAPDLDRLRARPDSAGVLRLEIRDEAYETHYLNYLGLVEVQHELDEFVLPEASGRPVAVRNLSAPVSGVDRTGRNVLDLLSEADGQVYRTSPTVLAAATAADLDDHIDLTFARPSGRDSVALVFRMRNSLLNTVLLYELMLGDPGIRSLDWVGRDLSNIGPAARLGRWYARHMGMWVAVWDGRDFRDVGRVPDTGPVAWKDVAVRFAIPSGDSLRVRLSFVADDWRIDQVRLAADVRTPETRTLTPVSLTSGDGVPDTAALARVVAPDTQYLMTTPGQRFFLRFAAGPGEPGRRGRARTFLLASQGYYIEWLRGDWLRTEHLASTFEPSDDALVSALRRWRSEKDDLERRFYATRVPVR